MQSSKDIGLMNERLMHLEQTNPCYKEIAYENFKKRIQLNCLYGFNLTYYDKTKFENNLYVDDKELIEYYVEKIESEFKDAKIWYLLDNHKITIGYHAEQESSLINSINSTRKSTKCFWSECISKIHSFQKKILLRVIKIINEAKKIV